MVRRPLQYALDKCVDNRWKYGGNAACGCVQDVIRRVHKKSRSKERLFDQQRLLMEDLTAN